MAVKATLTHIIDDSKVLHRLLLQRKTAGKFGEGKWNGPGGKLRLGEIPYDGAKREVYEETGLNVSNLKLHGILKHYFGEVSGPDWVVYIFSTRDFKGKLCEGEEGALRWFQIDEIPYDEMWQDDEHWVPLLLEGKRFNGEFFFNQDGTMLLDYNLNICV